VKPASISAVVPTFNDVGRLGDALSSIVNQTLPPAEIVVADDGSDDGTPHFVRDFAEQNASDVAIRYVRLPSRSRDAAARNAGIAAAQGDWIAICDSDDIWVADKLERQVHFIADWSGNQRIVLLGSHGYNVNDAKRVISPAIMGPTSEATYDAIRQRGGLFFLLHSTILFSRADFEAIGGYSTSAYGVASSLDFFCRIAERGVVINVPERLVYYRKRDGSMQLDLFWDQYNDVMRLAENQRRRANGRTPIGKEEYAAQLAAAPARKRLKRRKGMWGMYYYRRGATHIANGRRLRGSIELLAAFLLDRSRVRAGVVNALRNRRGGKRSLALPRRGGRSRGGSGASGRSPTPGSPLA
jgi:glycosyltransferase involved in cell wall biosynthesis